MLKTRNEREEDPEKVPADEARVFIVDDNVFYFNKAVIELCGQGVLRDNITGSESLVDARIKLVEMFKDATLPHVILLDNDFPTTEALLEEPMAAHFLEFIKDPKPDSIRYTTRELTEKMVGMNREQMAAALKEIAIIFHTSSVHDEDAFQEWKKNFPSLRLVDYSKDKAPDNCSVIQEIDQVVDF